MWRYQREKDAITLKQHTHCYPINIITRSTKDQKKQSRMYSRMDWADKTHIQRAKYLETGGFGCTYSFTAALDQLQWCSLFLSVPFSSLFSLFSCHCVQANMKLLVSTNSLTTGNEPLQLHRKLLTDYPEAICNDGSAARRVSSTSSSARSS